MPIFHDGELLGFAAVTAHVLDVGGSFPGINADAFDVYAEAKLYNALRWYRRGELNEDLDRMIFDNVRTETMNRGDMNAMLAACQLGRERFLRLVERYGADVGDERRLRLDGLLRADAARARSRRSPTATYGPIVGWLDDDARNRDVRLRVETRVIVEGDEITIDLTGSNPEVPTGYNVPFEGSLLVACYYAVRTILLDEATFPEHVPQNDGVFRPVKVIAPKGTIFNPNFPRACFSRFCQTQRVVDNVNLALAEALPEQGHRRQLGRDPLLRVRGLRRVGGRVLALPRGERGLVRRPLRQGRDGLGRQPDGEHAQQPDRGARHALPDALRPVRAAARAGRARASGAAASGSSGATASSSTARTRARATARPTRRAASSAAGTASSPRAARTRTRRPRRSLPAKVTGIPFTAGEFIEFREPNAAGYGDPLERDPAAVREDVLDDFTTIELARDAYGVVFADERTLEIDAAATAKLRAELAREPRRPAR